MQGAFLVWWVQVGGSVVTGFVRSKFEETDCSLVFCVLFQVGFPLAAFKLKD